MFWPNFKERNGMFRTQSMKGNKFQIKPLVIMKKLNSERGLFFFLYIWICSLNLTDLSYTQIQGHLLSHLKDPFVLWT
jgi:hypothetical protein